MTAELQIAKLEGVFAEPASAAAVAALQKLKATAKSLATDRVVCLITGSGLKATDVLQALTKKQKAAGLGLGGKHEAEDSKNSQRERLVWL